MGNRGVRATANAVSLLVLLAIAGQADSPPELGVCEDARVSLGQSKQDVRNALSVCCRVLADLPAFLKDDNQINFESKDGSRKCEGNLSFDAEERLVYASRTFPYNPLDAVTLADSIFQAVDRILQGSSVRTTKSNGWTTKSAPGAISLGKYSQPQGFTNEVELAFGDHRVILRGSPSGESFPHFVSISEEIGDIFKWVPLKREKSPPK